MENSTQHWQAALANIVQSPNSRLRFGEPLSKHTHFGIGGEAAAYFEVSTLAELASIARFHQQWQVPVAIIGRGSNLLVSDAGFSGIAIRLIGELAQLTVDGNTVTVGAGVSLPRLSKAMSRRGLSGVEFALGIPGSVGGALMMNAGAWGSSFGDVVTNVTVMHDTGELSQRSHAEARFEYRHSGLGDYFCVTGATLSLEPGDAATITKQMQAFYKQKVATQPFAEENAGCMFKNPPGDSAGRLIDVCGLKGHRIGGAEVSSVHGNFILNLDNATAADVLNLVAHIQQQVKAKTGVSLQTEVKRLGF
ncbi:hypothetical protein C6495_17705 [Candidatus Poribacteria bacterium]|nr:MAG: hypothetical protein C6495_17705 [Candidatus Poribacteria bacterium]